MTGKKKQESSEPDVVMDLKKLAVGYVRVSTTSQGTQGNSLAAQRGAIEEFARHAGYTLIEIFEDVASAVGLGSLSKREGLRNALGLATREKADLIVWDWDRLSRHADFDKQIRKFLPERERTICAKRGSSLRDAARHASFKHGEATAHEISRRTKEGMDKKRANGAVFGNPDIRTDVQPLGASKWSNDAKGLQEKIADVLRPLSDPYDLSYLKVADLLNELGLQTLHNKAWTASRVRKPVTKARQILREEEDSQLRSNPNFGMF